MHVWLEEMRKKERNGKGKEGEKMKEKEDQSQFYYLICHKINFFSLIPFPSSPILFSLLSFLQVLTGQLYPYNSH